MNRWQDDELFLSWLEKMGYIVGDWKISDGVVLYMWEAWRGAQGEKTW